MKIRKKCKGASRQRVEPEVREDRHGSSIYGDDEVLNSNPEDQFIAQRTRIDLNSNESSTDDISGEEVLDLNSEDSEFDDEEFEEERIYKNIKKNLRSKPDEEDEPEEEEEDAGWGKKSSYYEDQSESESENLEENEDEARRLQQKRRALLSEQDYFAAGAEQVDDDNEDNIDQVENELSLDYTPKPNAFMLDLLLAGKENKLPGSVCTLSQEQLKNIAKHNLSEIMPMFKNLRKFWDFAFKKAGPSIYFGTKDLSLPEDISDAYEFLRGLYFTCVSYCTTSLFYLLVRTDPYFKRERLQKVRTTLKRLENVLIVAQKTLGIDIGSNETQKETKSGISNLRDIVLLILKNGMDVVAASLDDSSDESQSMEKVEGAVSEEMSSDTSSTYDIEVESSPESVNVEILPMEDDDFCEADSVNNVDMDAKKALQARRAFNSVRLKEMDSIIKVKKKLSNPKSEQTPISEETPEENLDESLDEGTENDSKEHLKYYNKYAKQEKSKKKRLKAQRKKKQMEEIQERRNLHSMLDIQEEEVRPASVQIIKNRGLVPKRKRVQRNPRVKKRMKYMKSKIKVKSIRTEAVDKSTLPAYMGEKTGIKAELSRSTRFY